MRKISIFVLLGLSILVLYHLQPLPSSKDSSLSDSPESNRVSSPSSVIVHHISSTQNQGSKDNLVQNSESNTTPKSIQSPSPQVLHKISNQSTSDTIKVNLEKTQTTEDGKKSSLESDGPSIGSVKVLGHRGCDLNTQGWFLSVGAPEEYNFTISDDGETLTVEPKTPHITGQFELVHCTDAGALSGKRVQFTASVKTEAVSQIARLRLRGENQELQQITYAETIVNGTHGWKNYLVEADISPEVSEFSYGLTFRSTGKLWLSHPVISSAQ